MWGGMSAYGGGWGMGLGMVSMLLLWALIIVGVVVLVRWMAGSSGKS